MLSFFPRGVLDEILNLIESVSEDFSSYSCRTLYGCNRLQYVILEDAADLDELRQNDATDFVIMQRT